MKMYIILKDDIPDKLVPVITAHVSLACYHQYKNHQAMIEWMNGVFKKVVCTVNAREFEELKKESDHTLLTESALEHREVCLAFCPRDEYPIRFKYLRMWTPQGT